jgi:hypothetical protein
MLKGKAKVLRFYHGELDKYNHKPIYELLVKMAQKSGLAGATVYRGIMSYGANNSLHTAKILSLSIDLPIIVEIVDSEEKIMDFLNQIEKYFDKIDIGGMITIQDVDVILYKKNIEECHW